VVGNAVSRPTYAHDGYVSFPIYGPWGYNYPWYGSAFGWGLGYVYYDPWRYRGTMWGWGRYGMWYDPWGYYAYDPFMYGGGGGGGGGEYSEPRERKTTGSIRLKANVKEAKVYVDGALYGTVDEFDGFSDHLELDGGRHTLELRADGHETYRKEIVVDSGKTVTHRASLKNLKKK
jgi:PEGA domain